MLDCAIYIISICLGLRLFFQTVEHLNEGFDTLINLLAFISLITGLTCLAIKPLFKQIGKHQYPTSVFH